MTSGKIGDINLRTKILTKRLAKLIIAGLTGIYFIVLPLATTAADTVKLDLEIYN